MCMVIDVVNAVYFFGGSYINDHYKYIYYFYEIYAVLIKNVMITQSIGEQINPRW